MSLFETLYFQIHDVALRRPKTVVAIFLAAAMFASTGLKFLQLDLSFGPLFASSDELKQATVKFERDFGQSSGAWITAILENHGMTNQAFVREVAHMSDLVEKIPGITEVLSLTTLSVPTWDGGLSFIQPIPGHIMDDRHDKEFDTHFIGLLKNTQFVNWLVSPDGTKLTLSARLEPPMADLDSRRKIIDRFESLIRQEASPEVTVYFTGVSIIELAYEHYILRDQLTATTITAIILFLLLLWMLGDVRSVITCLFPTALAIPASLGVMGWLGQSITIINTTIPVIILVIGVADAVHMLMAWVDSHHKGMTGSASAHYMLSTTGKACFFTTITTIAGFIALFSAQLTAVRSFGLAVAIGVFIAWVSNQILVPRFLSSRGNKFQLPTNKLNQIADITTAKFSHFARTMPYRIIFISLMLFIACCFAAPLLDVDQRFNGELPASHPITRSQRVMEDQFSGFLGPDISIRKKNRANLIDEASLEKLRQYADALEKLPETRQVWSILDFIPAEVPEETLHAIIDDLKDEQSVSQRVSELVNRSHNQLAVLVRIGDIGTKRAEAFRNQVLNLATDIWGQEYEVEIVGQWWLAQHGMQLLMHDMLVSLGTALLLVLPLMWLAFRNGNLIIAATVANVLPLLIPLAFMALTGIKLRIGTAVIVAVALGIVVDNTLQLIFRLRLNSQSTGSFEDCISVALQQSGRAIVFTTFALAGGFLSMMSNDLIVIRDMGLVAAVTVLGAMFADLLLLPAMCIVLARIGLRPSPHSPLRKVPSSPITSF